MDKQEALRSLDEKAGVLFSVSDSIWDNPETAFNEVKACEWTAEVLRNAGFTVETGLYGMPTSIRASWGKGHPVVGFLGEYDALPGLSQELAAEKKPIEGQPYGHGCGQNLLGAATLGGVLGLKAGMEEKKLPGTIIYFGCPAEEVLTGKCFMARGGAFDDLDIAIRFHPGKTNLSAME